MGPKNLPGIHICPMAITHGDSSIDQNMGNAGGIFARRLNSCVTFNIGRVKHCNVGACALFQDTPITDAQSLGGQ